MTEKQTSLERTLTPAQKIELCHSRIHKMRHIVGFTDTGLIAPLPIWSPYPYPTCASEKFYMSGLEAQHPKYLPEILKPFVYLKKTGKRANNFGLFLRPGAFKRDEAKP